MTHYDTFILRLQSIVGSPEGERGMRHLRVPPGGLQLVPKMQIRPGQR